MQYANERPRFPSMETGAFLCAVAVCAATALVRYADIAFIPQDAKIQRADGKFRRHLDARCYTLICLSVNVVFTPPPSVMPTASSADSAMSITSPAVSARITLPLYRDPTPTDKIREIVACGSAVPFLRTDIVTVVPTAADTLV